MHGLGDTIYNNGKEQGIEIGIEIGRMKELVLLVKNGLLNLGDASKRANMTEPEFLQLMECDEKENV